MSELKPCPFCGEEIYSEFYSHRTEEFDGHCTNKKCVLYGKDFLFFNTAKWNSRPIEDQLRAENERLREALKEIIALDDGNSILKYYERYYQVFRLARQALKEVTNSESDYKEQIRNMSENEYRKLTEGRWTDEESEDEMTEFTPEWIAGAREVVGNDAASPSGQIAFIALDHIERLQKRIEELEAAISNQSALVYKFENMASDLLAENDLLKNNPEAEKYYYQKWVDGKQRIAELEQERRWIPVSERLPIIFGWYLVYGRDASTRRNINVEYFRLNSKTFSGGFNITHWQPLPQPPKEVE
jgi:hypothetical protein